MIEGNNPSVGIAYLSLPSDLDRSEYINLCLKTSTVCMRCEDGSFYTRVPVISSVLDKLEFPLTIQELGLPLLFINEPTKNQPIVIGTINFSNYLPNLKEGEFKIKREWGDSYTEISGSAKEERISMLINAKNKGIVSISIASDQENGKFKLDVQGDIELAVSKDFTLTSHKNITLQTSIENEDEAISFTNLIFTSTGKERVNYSDEFENKILILEDKINFKADKSKKIDFGNGKEKAVLGDTLLKKLQDYDKLHAQATYSTAFGPTSTRINEPQFAKLVVEFKEILSQLVNLD